MFTKIVQFRFLWHYRSSCIMSKDLTVHFMYFLLYCVLYLLPYNINQTVKRKCTRGQISKVNLQRWEANVSILLFLIVLIVLNGLITSGNNYPINVPIIPSKSKLWLLEYKHSTTSVVQIAWPFKNITEVICQQISHKHKNGFLTVLHSFINCSIYQLINCSCAKTWKDLLWLYFGHIKNNRDDVSPVTHESL